MQINDINIMNCTSLYMQSKKMVEKLHKYSITFELFVVQFRKITQKSSAHFQFIRIIVRETVMGKLIFFSILMCRKLTLSIIWKRLCNGLICLPFTVLIWFLRKINLSFIELLSFRCIMVFFEGYLI